MGFASLFIGPGAMLLEIDTPDSRGEGAILVVIAGIGALYLGFAVIRIIAGSARGSWPRRLLAPFFGLFVVAAPLGVMVDVVPLASIAAAWCFPIFLFLLNRHFFLPVRRRAAEEDSLLKTRFLDVTLDPDTDVLDGEIVRGRFKGRILSALSPDELDSLMEEVASDPDSVSILTAIFMQFGESGTGKSGSAGEHEDRGRDRRNGSGGRQGGAAGHAGGRMDAAEAFRVLGLEPGASEKEILATHRRLMKMVHPDTGGSDYLASKVNEARDLLLGL